MGALDTKFGAFFAQVSSTWLVNDMYMYACTLMHEQCEVLQISAVMLCGFRSDIFSLVPCPIMVAAVGVLTNCMFRISNLARCCAGYNNLV